MQVLGYHLPHWAVVIWVWLPWIVGGIAGAVSFVTNCISIWESKTFRKWFGDTINRWRALRLTWLRRKVAELEAESEL